MQIKREDWEKRGPWVQGVYGKMAEFSDSRRLYARPDLYRRVFPVDAEESGFFATFLSGEVRVVDLGGGGGELLAAMGVGGLTLDLSRELLAGGTGPRVRGRIEGMPFAEGVFDAAISRLFGVAYAAAMVPVEDIWREVARVLSPGGQIVLELPLHYRPRALQGVEERAEVAGGAYRFRYLDVLRETEWGAVLAAEIEFVLAGDRYRVEDPLHVFSPEALVRLLREAGFGAVQFFPSYDAGSPCEFPPAECHRGVVHALLGGA